VKHVLYRKDLVTTTRLDVFRAVVECYVWMSFTALSHEAGITQPAALTFQKQQQAQPDTRCNDGPATQLAPSSLALVQ